MNAPEKIIPELDRSTFLGGSDAAAVMGLSPWTTPVQLWLEKTGQRKRETPDATRQRILERGKKLEPYVLEMVVDRLMERGLDVQIVARNERYTDPQHGFLACEIDFELLVTGEVVVGDQVLRLQDERINGDCKTVHGFARKKWGDQDTEDVPIEYAAQFMHGLMVTDRRLCLVAALIGLDDVGIYWVLRDDETIAGMRAREVDFWTRCVLAGERPDPLTFDDVKALYPRDNGQAVAADEATAQAVQQLASVKAQIKLLQEREDALTLAIGDFISPHAILTHAGREIATWKGQAYSNLDQKGLCAAHPDIADQFTRRGTTRVLRLKKEKA